MGIIGISASFIPHGILTFIGLSTNQPLPLLIQVMGAMYFAFAMINWFAKNNLIGGIYGKPIAIGNFSHLMISSLALVKGINNDSISSVILAIAVVYLISAILFSFIAFCNPVKRDKAILKNMEWMVFSLRSKSTSYAFAQGLERRVGFNIVYRPFLAA